MCHLLDGDPFKSGGGNARLGDAQRHFRENVVELFNMILLYFHRSRRWHTQRWYRKFETRNSIGSPLHTEDKDTEIRIAYENVLQRGFSVKPLIGYCLE